MTLCMTSLIVGACSSSPQKQNAAAAAAADSTQTLYLLVGSYATPEEESVKVYRFDETTGDAVYLSGLKGISNPSFVTQSASGDRVYAVGEDEGDTSAAHAIRFDRESGKLTLLNSQPSRGAAPCYIALSPCGRFIVTANYGGGSITVFALDSVGGLRPDTHLIPFSGTGPNKDRQMAPHLHLTAFSPDGGYLLGTDLGTDRIHIFPLGKQDAATTPATFLDEQRQHDVAVTPSAGPRHLCFHPSLPVVYLLNELSGEVNVFSFREGEMEALQTIAADTVQGHGSADIHPSPDGKFVYASNRLKADGIAIFAADAEKGLLTKVGYQPTGLYPRHFTLTPDGRFLLVACRDSHAIQVFRRDTKTGLLIDTGKTISTSKPTCLSFFY